ncbi:MAG: carbohydrate ABC transporter permease [Anaerolineae bacterium]|nr:carbohydrate ABC transporter permease [Anaerolineae bacterium]
MTQQSLQANRSAALSTRTRKRRIQLRQVPAYLFLGAWSAFTILALSWVVLASVKTNREVFRQPFQIPAEPQWVNYERVWSNSQVGQSFLNSLLIVGVSVVLILVVSAPASYILSRARFKGRGLLTMIYIAGIGIPYPLLFIPLFALLAGIKLINTMPGLILIYVSLSIPFTVYILTGFFSTLPQELEDAAVIDGASDFQVFRKVMLPLASPGLLTASIFNFIGLWNEFQLALIFIQDPDKRPLSLSLYTLKNSMTYSGDWAALFAGVVIVVVPTILLYIWLSERMISGMTLGSVK